MSEHKKNTHDFTPKYNSVAVIRNDDTLLPSEKVREQVKHYAMCLFGLATDMANAEQAIIDKRHYITKLETQNAKLKAEFKAFVTRHRNGENVVEKELRDELARERAKTKVRINKLTSQERIAVQADYYEKRIHDLQSTLTYYKDKCKLLEQEVERQKRGNNGE